MNIEQVLKISFDKYFNAPIEAWKDFAELCEPITFKKYDVIKKENTSERYFYFIISGSVPLLTS